MVKSDDEEEKNIIINNLQGDVILIKVIIVEDDPMVRSINSKFLGKVEGFEIIGATGDYEEAQKLIKILNPNLVLIDVYLPTGDGINLLKWMRKEEIAADGIMITAERDIYAVQEALRYGAVDYLVKPFEFQRFKEALSNYRELCQKVKVGHRVEQDFIDTYLKGKKNEDIEEVKEKTSVLVKGINEITYNQIWNYIKEGSLESFVAEDLANTMGLARVTVRRYLEHMASEGSLTVDLEYGKVGRPTNIYRCKISKFR